ncbi:hypothetical protein L519_2165 [Bordetella bronchiseptica MBORD678]|uniref:hypothetical protein n=1 Tax=Bordetella bronchiseptica TaxID=518 RepID=UPI00049F255B|nr:hypothetical protein [Bordetella bronchiseptica]KDD89734.1 hypothetical protein L519_2165 [Bordetella bronchiseptica MBORD678]
MTQIDLIAGQPAGVEMDPMQGTLQAFGGRTAFQCQARGCDGCMVCVPDSFARAQGEIANLRNSSSSAPGVNVSILALDLGTKLGWAMMPRGGQITHGTESFAPRKSWSPGQRWQRFRAWLSRTIAENNVGLVVFEDVKRHAPGAVLAAHAYGGFRAMLEMVVDQHNVRVVPVGVGTIKKHWTGKGNADKAAMLAQAKARGFRPETDNDADALAILSWAVAQERAA